MKGIPGPVYAARDHIWALLSEPVTVRHVIAATGLDYVNVYSCIARARRAGLIVPVSETKNERRTGVRTWSTQYQQAPAWRAAAGWPVRAHGVGETR